LDQEPRRPDYGAPADDADYVDSYGAKLRGTMFENVSGRLRSRRRSASAAVRRRGSEDLRLGLSVGDAGRHADAAHAEERAVIAHRRQRRHRLASRHRVMVECKTYDPRTNLADPKTENVFQTHVQMGLVRELTEYKPTHSILSYTDASWWSEGKEFIIEFDPQIYENAKKRARAHHDGEVGRRAPA
jgi:hypothetical protein